MTVADACASLAKCLTFYNLQSPYKPLTGKFQTVLTSTRPNQSRLRHKAGSHPTIKTVELSEQTEPLHSHESTVRINRATLNTKLDTLPDMIVLLTLMVFVATINFFFFNFWVNADHKK